MNTEMAPACRAVYIHVMPDTPPSKTIVIAGGSGFLGVSLAFHLAAAGKSVVILSRTAPKITELRRHIAWAGFFAS